MIEENTICDALDKYDVQPGDVFFLPAGRIHSIGAGCFLAEIQQTSNITYRIYDFNRRDKNGNLRELHTELSKDAIDYTVENDYRTHYTPHKDEPVELVSCPYFTTSVYNLTESMTMDYSELDSFVIYICMKGSCTVTDNEGNCISLKAGESVLFPATTQTWKSCQTVKYPSWKLTYKRPAFLILFIAESFSFPAAQGRKGLNRFS